MPQVKSSADLGAILEPHAPENCRPRPAPSPISGRVSLILRLDDVESGAFLPLIVPVWNEFCPPSRERGRVMPLTQPRSVMFFQCN